MQLKELNFIISCQIFWLNILNLRAFWAFEKVDIDCECFQGFRGVHSFVMQFYLQSVNIAGFFSNMYNKCTKCGVSLRFLQPSFLNIEKKKTMYPVNPCKHLQSISTFSKVPQTDSWYVATEVSREATPGIWGFQKENRDRQSISVPSPQIWRPNYGSSSWSSNNKFPYQFDWVSSNSNLVHSTNFLTGGFFKRRFTGSAKIKFVKLCRKKWACRERILLNLSRSKQSHFFLSFQSGGNLAKPSKNTRIAIICHSNCEKRDIGT